MRKISLLITLLLTPTLALAHPGHLETGAVAGLLHPFTGFDHLLAMLAVGLWAGRMGGAARWQLPLTFVGVMLIGAIAGLNGVMVPLLETALAATVLVLGLLIALALPLVATARVLLVGGFAFLHGLAHGAELPGGAHALTYMTAFVVSTSVLHGLGLIVAAKLPQSMQPLLRWLGAAIGVAGGVLLLG